MRKRAVSTLLVVIVLAGGVFVVRTVSGCARWQETYKRLLYTEIMQNGPVILRPAMIDKVIGERPFGCDRPSRSLSQQDLDRFGREGVSWDLFNDEWRAAFERTDGFKDI